jgi:hypothetical protein
VKLYRLFGSAAIELRVAQAITEHLGDRTLHQCATAAYGEAARALRRLLERKDCALTPTDAQLLDSTIKRGAGRAMSLRALSSFFFAAAIAGLMGVGDAAMSRATDSTQGRAGTLLPLFPGRPALCAP